MAGVAHPAASTRHDADHLPQARRHRLRPDRIVGGARGASARAWSSGSPWPTPARSRVSGCWRSASPTACTKTPAEAVRDADLVIFATPPLSIEAVAFEVAHALKPGATVSDVGSVKAAIAEAFARTIPDTVFAVPGHPIAGSEQSGPDAGFAAMFEGRWTILTPQDRADAPYRAAVERLTAFWLGLGAQVETMDVRHHDLVLAVTSHLPHLIAYNIVGTRGRSGGGPRAAR